MREFLLRVLSHLQAARLEVQKAGYVVGVGLDSVDLSAFGAEEIVQGGHEDIHKVDTTQERRRKACQGIHGQVVLGKSLEVRNERLAAGTDTGKADAETERGRAVVVGDRGAAAAGAEPCRVDSPDSAEVRHGLPDSARLARPLELLRAQAACAYSSS